MPPNTHSLVHYATSSTLPQAAPFMNDEPLKRVRSVSESNVNSIVDATDGDAVCDACPFCDDVCSHKSCMKCAGKILKFVGHCRQRTKMFTMCQIKRHNRRDDCWIVAHNTVYNITKWIATGKHPGGNDCMVRKAGSDVTVDFDFHQAASAPFWQTMAVGRLRRCDKGAKPKRWYAFWS